MFNELLIESNLDIYKLYRKIIVFFKKYYFKKYLNIIFKSTFFINNN
jgi:hypothetical protein